jgi:hypothetical protein
LCHLSGTILLPSDQNSPSRMSTSQQMRVASSSA